MTQQETGTTKAAQTQAGLNPGDRVANFSLVDDAGQLFLFYEAAVGDPMVLFAYGGATPPEKVEESLAAMNGWWRAKPDIPMIAIHPGAVQANAALAEKLDLVFPLLTDTDRALAPKWFGDAVASGNGLYALIVDRNLRVVERVMPDEDRTLTKTLVDVAPVLARRAASPAGTAAMTAPVLVVPDVLPADFCRSLIDRFEGWSPEVSAMPTIVDGKVALAPDPERKVRRDVVLKDEAVVQQIAGLLARRVLPEMQKAFWYRATRFENLKLVAYEAGAKGHFAAHRDNTAPDTAHRRFAMTLNLNTPDYEGGGLVFPEYGETVYAPDPGAAIVFSGSHAHAVQKVTKGTRYALITFMSADPPQRAPDAPTPQAQA